MATQLRLPRFVLTLTAALAAATVTQPLASSAAAGQSPSATSRAETRHLILTTSASAVRAGRAVLNVDVVLKPKMHVYAPDQPKDQHYMPIVLTVASGDG